MADDDGKGTKRTQLFSMNSESAYNGSAKAQILEDYDPDKIKDDGNLTTYRETLLHMLKISLGTGILAMPRAFANAGYLLGIVGTLTVGTISIYSIHLLVGDQYFTPTDVRIYMLYLLGPLILICWLRNLKYLAPVSTFGNFATLVCYCIIFRYMAADLPSFSTREAVVDLNRLPLFMGTALFAMEAVGVVMPLKNEMREPRQFRSWFGVLNCAMVPATFLFLLVGLCGYLKYGDSAKGSITLNLPANELPAQCVKLTLAFSMYISFAICAYVTFTILWQDFMWSTFVTSSRKIVWEYAVRTLLVIAMFILAFAIPNLELFISLIGALGLANLGLAFPAIMEILTFWDSHHGCRFALFLTKNVCLLLVAIYAFFIGGSTSIINIYNRVILHNTV